MSHEWFTVVLQAMTLLTAIIVAITAVISAVKIWIEVREVHKTINSRLTEFIELAKTSSHAAGMLEQKEKEATDPLPVIDDRTASATERVADAMEKKNAT